jgi:hypothetical protein
MEGNHGNVSWHPSLMSQGNQDQISTDQGKGGSEDAAVDVVLGRRRQHDRIDSLRLLIDSLQLVTLSGTEDGLQRIISKINNEKKEKKTKHIIQLMMPRKLRAVPYCEIFAIAATVRSDKSRPR